MSQAKFDEQVTWFRDYEAVLRARGFLLIEATFPRFIAAVCVPQIRPNVVLFAVAIDYTNWDVEPPSVRVVDPFTRRPLLGKELVSFMKRRVPQRPAVGAAGQEVVAEVAPMKLPSPPGAAHGMAVAVPVAADAPVVVPMLQFSLPDDVPFLCLAGVREYHEHPAHTGDAWWLHRTTGAGSLSHLLNVFHSYAIAPITGFAADIGLRGTPSGLTAEIRGITLATDLPT